MILKSTGFRFSTLVKEFFSVNWSESIIKYAFPFPFPFFVNAKSCSVEGQFYYETELQRSSFSDQVSPYVHGAYAIE